MKSSFSLKQNIHSLSIKDLLEARDLFHTHLYNLPNVIATAIGLFRIRKSDPDVSDPTNTRSKENSPPRTLSNSIVTPHSSPCILVLVDKWLTLDELKDDPDQVIPSFLYMPNGKKIPICVIYSQQKHTSSQLLNINFPTELLGGGYPIFTEVQGKQYVGSIGCLVTDGDSIYALTNRHVTGEKLEHNIGRKIYTIVNGKRYRIGTSSHKQIGKKPFEEIYKGWVGSRIYTNIDVGLVLIDDINNWTSQVFGIGEVGEPIDLNINNISLDVIDCPLRAFGAASGEMIGKIDALFYRYKSMGGFEYVSDLLIGPLDKDLNNIPGNSGTVWFYDPRLEKKYKISKNDKSDIVRKGLRAHQLQPLAIEWGGHNLFDDQNGREFNFVLASFLSNVCRELDVDLVRNWNIGYSQYWGKLGHYKIAQKSCSLVSNHKLKKLLEKNLKFIAFSDDDLISGEQERIPSNGIVPLADVPDLVWRNTRFVRDDDEGNHFADMDEEGNEEFNGKTLFDLTEDPSNVKIETWNSFYDSINLELRGALPFRIWQIYKMMVNYIQNADMTKFVCAAGILSHYIGDACQPLHATKFYNGRNQNEQGVHSAYEKSMLDRFAADIIGKVNSRLQNVTVNSAERGQQNAAISLIHLMSKCKQILSPLEIIEGYVHGGNTNNRLRYMFELLGDRTATCLAEGCIELATVWENAWIEGNGEQIEEDNLRTLNPIELKNLYENREFLPSYKLQDPRYTEILNL